MKGFVVPAGLALLCLLMPLRVRAQEDQYLRVYTLIQEADGLRNNQQPAQALPRYLEAQAALLRLQRVYPEWNSKVVSYRLKYLADRIADVSARAPASAAAGGAAVRTNSPAGAPPAHPAMGEIETQLNQLQGQIRQLQTDKTLLESKLKEALSAQPAAIDPRELTRSQEQVKSLQKENDLLKVNLDQKSKTPGAVDAKALEQLKRDLDESNRALAAQTEAVSTLALEKKVLQNKLNSLIAAPWNETNLAATRVALDETNRKLGDQTDATGQLMRERETMLARIKALTAEAEAATALRAENEILKKQLTELKSLPPGESQDTARQLAEAKAQVAALQSDKEVLRLEKAALENRLKQIPTTPGPAGPAATVAMADAARVKQLESERDDLQKKLDTAQKDLDTRKNSGTAAKVEDLSRQLDLLRTRIGIFEAQKVPYTTEELALFKKPETQLTDAKANKKPARELPPGAITLVTQAERDFAARRFDQAEEKYLQVLRQDEKNVYTLANLAAIQLEMNRFDDAEKNITQALELAPEDGYSLSILGYLKFRQQKYDDALDVLARAAKLNPQSAEVQNYLGLTLSQKGMRLQGETALRKAIELDPNYASAHYNLAVIYVTQRPPATELARLHYKKALAAGLARNADMEKMLGLGQTP